jgi:hypothetical protein
MPCCTNLDFKRLWQPLKEKSFKNTHTGTKYRDKLMIILATQILLTSLSHKPSISL